MKKSYILTAWLLFTAFASFAQQSTNWSAPDSGTAYAKSGSGPMPGWNYSNPLSHTGSAFNPYIFSMGGVNNTSDYLFLHDYDLNIPLNATITGLELIITRGGCNSGDYILDTLSLAQNGVAIGNSITDSLSSGADTLGDSNDNWGASLTPAIVNSADFGILYSYRSVGTCTYAVFDCRIKIHYMTTTGLNNTTSATQVMIYPNPTKDNITIETNSVDRSYTLHDQLGRCILSGTILSPTTTIITSALSPDVYYIRLKESGTVLKFIKN